MTANPVIEDRLVHNERAADVALIRMTQPETRNALTVPMRAALERAIAEANADPAVRAIVIAGEAKVFSAGGDISTMVGMTREEAECRIRLAHTLPRAVHQSAKPVVAAVEGICAGAGLSLAAICDLLVCGEKASFFTAFERVGLMPDLGASWSVTARMGVAAARRLFLLGGNLDSAQAEASGLADLRVPAGTAEKEAIDLARRLGNGAPASRCVVRDLFRAPPASLEEALALEAEHQPRLYLGPDLQEGIQAFRERRDPVWRHD